MRLSESPVLVLVIQQPLTTLSVLHAFRLQYAIQSPCGHAELLRNIISVVRAFTHQDGIVILNFRSRHFKLLSM